MVEKNMYSLFLKNLVNNFCDGSLKNRLPLQQDKEKALSIVLNGPSVNRTIQYLNKEETDIMMVNYAPLTPLFKELNPQYMCFSDVYFMKHNKKNQMLWAQMAKSGDRLTVFLPHYMKKPTFFPGKNLKIQYVYSPREIERYDMFSYKLLEENIVAPVYYNVSIMCIYIGIQMGYKKIDLYGADADFMKNLSVDKSNRVIRDSVHYYGTRTFCENTFHRYDMEIMMYMGYMTFHELKKLKKYAVKENVKIVNMSDSSWIDFFKRYNG